MMPVMSFSVMSALVSISMTVTRLVILVYVADPARVVVIVIVNHRYVAIGSVRGPGNTQADAGGE
jgi:hypothetical protein